MPCITACRTGAHLNTLLVPAFMANLTPQQQLLLITTNDAVREAFIGVFHRLQRAVNNVFVSKVNCYEMPWAIVGPNIILNIAEQISLYNYLASNRSSGLAYLVFNAQRIQGTLDRQRRTLYAGT